MWFIWSPNSKKVTVGNMANAAYVLSIMKWRFKTEILNRCGNIF